MIFFNLNTCLWTMYRFCKEKLHVGIPTLLLVLFVNNAICDTIWLTRVSLKTRGILRQLILQALLNKESTSQTKK